jgi:hypothetical protein
MTQSPHHETLAPAAVVRRVAAELDGCRHLLARIEAAFHAMQPDAPPLQGQPLNQVQDIDLLGQILADLTHVLVICSDEPSVRAARRFENAEALSVLRLNDLRLRLAGTPGTAPIERVEFF